MGVLILKNLRVHSVLPRKKAKGRLPSGSHSGGRTSWCGFQFILLFSDVGVLTQDLAQRGFAMLTRLISNPWAQVILVPQPRVALGTNFLFVCLFVFMGFEVAPTYCKSVFLSSFTMFMHQDLCSKFFLNG